MPSEFAVFFSYTISLVSLGEAILSLSISMDPPPEAGKFSSSDKVDKFSSSDKSRLEIRVSVHF